MNERYLDTSDVPRTKLHWSGNRLRLSSKSVSSQTPLDKVPHREDLVEKVTE